MSYFIVAEFFLVGIPKFNEVGSFCAYFLGLWTFKTLLEKESIWAKPYIIMMTLIFDIYAIEESLKRGKDLLHEYS